MVNSRPFLAKSLSVSFCSSLFLSSCSFLGNEGSVENDTDHRVYEGEAPSYSQVNSVSGVAWEWEVPDEDASLSEVLSGQSGPVMVLGDGVVGLDGATGEELWHYRVASGGVHDVWSTPGGQEILLTTPGSKPDTMVLLDAGTGQLIAEHGIDLEEALERTVAVTSDMAVVAPTQGEGPLEAFSLREGERVWTYELAERGDSAGAVIEDVLSVGETVVVTASYKGSISENDSVDIYEQGMLAVGLDGQTGELLWEVEQEFTADMWHEPEHEVSPGGEVFFLSVRGEDRYEFLLDPDTGEEVQGEVYRDRTERHSVALLDGGYVDSVSEDEDDFVEYRRMSFGGDLLGRASVQRLPGEGNSGPELVLEDGVLRLGYLEDEDLVRGPVVAEFVEWGSESEPEKMNLDMTVNEEWWSEPDPSFSLGAPVVLSVPGAVVVTEDEPGPWTVVGLT